jgi:hypothetical protein
MPPQPPVGPSTEPSKLLKNWSALNAYLRAISSSRELISLLRYAVEEETRGQVVERIYGRYAKLRSDEERKALKDGYVPTTIRSHPA